MFLDTTNQELSQILVDDSTYSYDVYCSLLILTHNFRTFIDPNYLNVSVESEYFRKSLSKKIVGRADLFLIICVRRWLCFGE